MSQPKSQNWLQGDRFFYLAHECRFTGFYAGKLHFTYVHHGRSKDGLVQHKRGQ